ncbi:toll/interleukin-1 receptor domain-containing protein [Alkalibacillus silvisoli]|uniref:TIR domain-containing protein n=1 Tax=Alkalibacillus silvisoli TaxID=392823 RepID=A0ABN0ZQI8_9BACI
MALFNAKDLKRRANNELNKSIYSKSASTILNESYQNFNYVEAYDIFLSHSYQDAEIILGLKNTLEDLGYKVYVDWIIDRDLSRDNVNTSTASRLRKRMRSCKCLIYATSNNSNKSKWMPWELGYFDGWKGKVSILPINEESVNKETFDGQEYLGLYSYVVKGYFDDLYIKDLNGKRKSFREWLRE